MGLLAASFDGQKKTGMLLMIADCSSSILLNVMPRIHKSTESGFYFDTKAAL